MTTPNSNLPELIANQAQPHLTLNDALRRIDALLQASYIAQQNAPPGSPDEGDRYLVGSSPTGDWAGHPGELVMFSGGIWTYAVPQEGWMVYLRSAGSVYIYGIDSPPTWTALVTGGDILSDLNWANEGDLVYGTGVGAAAILPSWSVGAGMFLKADPGGSPPLIWATPPGGGGFVPVARSQFFPGQPVAGQCVFMFTANPGYLFNLTGDFVIRARVPPADTSMFEFYVFYGDPTPGNQLGTIYVDSSGEGYGTLDGNDFGPEPFALGVGDFIGIYAQTPSDVAMEDLCLDFLTVES